MSRKSPLLNQASQVSSSKLKIRSKCLSTVSFISASQLSDLNLIVFPKIIV